MTTVKKSSTTTVCIILHAHLPYVRSANTMLPLEEIWLYQNIAECYIPLIQMCQRLIKKNIQPSLAISISPTLLTMLTQQYYHTRFKYWAHTILECIEILKRKNSKAERSLNFYDNFITGALTYFERIHGDCTDAFGELFKNNSIELLTTAATHPFLPLYRNYPDIQNLQIMAGLQEFEKKFITKPNGFWLPEMGYHTGIDEKLCQHGISYTIVNDKSVLLSNNIPKTGNFFPAKIPTGIVVFPRDAVLSMKIWSSHAGYPGHPFYREFHRDAVYELSELSPYNEQKLLGLKIYAISGSENKEYYDPAKAKEMVRQHVNDFIATIVQRAEDVEKIIKRKPVFVLPFDAELFGHWWFEGPLFLELLLETIASRDDMMCVMPQELLMEDMEIVEPVESSWGKGNDFSTWYNAHVRHTVLKLEELLYRFNKLLYSTEPALQQCAREMMLAMASDWQFMISTGSYSDYAVKRFDEHSNAAAAIMSMIEQNKIDREYIHQRFDAYPVFEDINTILFMLGRK